MLSNVVGKYIKIKDRQNRTRFELSGRPKKIYEGIAIQSY